MVAGLSKEIEALLNSNPGLQSRFHPRYRFHLDDYSADELGEIFRGFVKSKGYCLDDEAET